MPTKAATNDSAELHARIEALRPTLLRLAQLQLRNLSWAEDAVSETLLAALEGAARFSGKSQFKTWVVGILKHKVLDQLRLRQRECGYDSDENDDPLEDLMFKADGHFQTVPQNWDAPAAALQQRQFFEVLETCMELLPGQIGRVFLMREWLELDTKAICQELRISPTNVWQMLSRARLRLRECLQLNWFGPSSS
ncbi:sigma-70 family RNA polymerase sigma factor [Thiomonas sp. FB-Cd]|uniref:sigma-70 family RNA polymerase sigma factor n=1 Tax=Thiomonas sp. FB-Cd TaxID=1158292 RepID=UPI0004DF7F24|nr:sigma-70 family RNA polymerase sigma factor [Thiomonas sp. FB-Cd]